MELREWSNAAQPFAVFELILRNVALGLEEGPKCLRSPQFSPL